MTQLSVLLVNDLAPGPGSGVEVHVARVARGLAAAGHRVDVYHARPKHGWRRGTDLWDERARREVRARARTADVVHVHNVLRELSPSVLGAAPDAPLVVTVHDHRLFTPDRPRTGRRVVDGFADGAARTSAFVARRALRRHADAVLAVSDGLATRLQTAGIGPVTVTPPFADVDPAPWTAPSGLDVVYAGRLATSKGLEVLLDAFPLVASDVPGARLRLLGAGPDDLPLRVRAAALPPGVDVVFEGLRDEDGVRAALREARVVCLPSLAAEGFPQLVVETLLVGRTIVASDLPANRAALRDGRDGVLVPPGEAAALAAALSVCLRGDHDDSDRLHASRTDAEDRFGIDAGVARLVDTYQHAIRRRG